MLLNLFCKQQVVDQNSLHGVSNAMTRDRLYCCRPRRAALKFPRLADQYGDAGARRCISHASIHHRSDNERYTPMSGISRRIALALLLAALLIP